MTFNLHHGDAATIVDTLDVEVQCTVTSPPYLGLRDYSTPAQIGHESLDDYVSALVEVFSAVRGVTAKRGTLWINLGDSYNAYNGNRGAGTSFSSSRASDRRALPTGHGLVEKSLPNKSLMGAPWRVALAIQDSGWILRNSIIWRKPHPAPERVRDRLARSHEHVFMFSKSDRYDFDLDFLRSPGARTPLDVWEFGYDHRTDHPAAFPLELPRRCIGLGSSRDSTVLDPFVGSGTTGVAALALGRRFIGIDSNQDYLNAAKLRLETA